ncbi:tRNA dimethylallyltransferase [Tyrophagus putrescentiae]|nr:tRNA dimethylallyltransferase [Tyrophagus putrescentiae]
MFRKLPILPWATNLKKCINSQRMAATMPADAQSKYQHAPLIVIIGTTGCGKTKLSLELARRFNGEVISADSMQIYRGLELATANTTAEEQAQQFTVLDFQRLALAAIESILWDTLVSASNSADEGLVDTDEMNIVKEKDQSSDKSVPPLQAIDTLEELLSTPISYRRLEAVPSETLHRLLTEVGPCSGRSLHPHNRQMVIRALQRYCEREVLESRLERRVDQMMRERLIEELQAFHLQYNSLRLQQNQKTGYTESIFQAIGLKEFHRYLLMDDDDDGQQNYEATLALGHGILLLKQRTKSYVSRQLKWIRRRFLVPKSVRRVPPFYRLDTSRPDRWHEDVYGRTVELVEATARQDEDEEARRMPTQQREPFKDLKNADGDDDAFISGQFTCDLCQVAISGGRSYQMHLRSKGHRAGQAAKTAKRREEQTAAVRGDDVIFIKNKQ